jgi:hypothetical protein
MSETDFAKDSSFTSVFPFLREPVAGFAFVFDFRAMIDSLIVPGCTIDGYAVYDTRAIRSLTGAVLIAWFLLVPCISVSRV